MNGYQILSAACLVIGSVFMWSSLEKVGVAASCDEVTHRSKKCINAHAGEPVQNGSSSYCEWSNNNCQQASGSLCTDKYGVGYAGECDPLMLGTAHVYDCFEDAFETFVYIPYFTASCVQNNAECNCVWTEATSPAPQMMQLCDCYDVEVED